MKKSRAVSISLVSSLAGAALSAGCGTAAALRRPGWEACVDRTRGVVVDPQYCGDLPDEPAQPPEIAPELAPQFAWYYYPWTYYWEGPEIGAYIPSGGAFGLQPFVAVPSAGTGVIERGGFGSIGTSQISAGG